jgi:site-specific recombinase XerD
MSTALVSIRPTEALAPAPQIPTADRHPAIIYIASLGSPASRRTMRQALDVCAQIISSGRHDALSLPWHELRFQHTQAIRTALIDRSYSPASCNKALAALRGTLKACWRLGMVDGDTYHRAADVAGVRGERLPRGRALSQGELRALFAACAEDPSPAGVRDAALLAVLYGGGLRRSEATSLDLEDYTAGTGELKIRHAKGNKQRIVYVNGGGGAALAAWLVMRGAEPGPLFYPINHGGRILRRWMTAQVCRWMLLKRAREAAGVQSCSPHDFRRTFISDLIDAGVDLVTVQKLAGHANVQTTARYDRRSEAAKRQVAAKLHVPYRAPAK